MARSQRHKVLVQSYSSIGSVNEQGVIAPAVTRDAGSYTTPVGPAGGPLKGSSMAGPPPSGVPVPTVGTLTPNTAVRGGADLVMTVTGTNFNKSTVIMFNNGQERTTYISPTQVSTIVKPSLVSIAGPYPVSVTNAGVHKSNSQNFTFT